MSNDQYSKDQPSKREQVRSHPEGGQGYKEVTEGSKESRKRETRKNLDKLG